MLFIILVALTEGKTTVNATNIMNNIWQYDPVARNVYAGRIGYGKADKAIITATILEGVDMTANSVVGDATGFPGMRYRNMVASLSALINYHDLMSVSAEAAKSLTSPLSNQEANPTLSLPGDLFSNNTSGSTAFSIKGMARRPVVQTRITDRKSVV